MEAGRRAVGFIGTLSWKSCGRSAREWYHAMKMAAHYEPRRDLVSLDEHDPWLIDEFGGKPITPRVVGEAEDFARIDARNFLLEPLVWMFAGYVLHGTPAHPNAWNDIYDILGYWMVLFVMLPLRLLDTDRPRDLRFRLEYVGLQMLTLAGGLLGWFLAGG